MARNLSNRLIAFFDVLGFSQRLRTMPAEVLHREYAALIDEVAHTVFRDRRRVLHADGTNGDAVVDNFAKAQFLFDSLILVSHDASQVQHVSDFVLACVLLMEKCFAAQYPLRGAIGRGDVVEDEDRNIFLSRVFPDLVQAEKVQSWTGCYVLSNCESFVLEALFGSSYATGSRKPEARFPLVPFEVPARVNSPDATPGTQWCLNWPYLMGSSNLANGLAFLDAAKRPGTEKFIDHVFALPDQSQVLAPEYAPARIARVLVTRSGFRPAILNEFGDPAPEAGAVPFTVVPQGEG